LRETLVDPVVALNNLLQHSPEGNITSEFNWKMSQTGPNNQAVHHAIAKCRYKTAQRNVKLAKHAFATVRGVSIGEGKGTSKGLAKGVAAKKAFDHLEEKWYPQQQRQQD
jgi:hypothetical protein